MALNKAITNAKGIETSYHKICKISLVKSKPKNEEDETSHLICANVFSYVTEEHRRAAENSAVSNRDYHIKVTLAELETTPMLTLAYARLKALPMFEGAEDC